MAILRNTGTFAPFTTLTISNDGNTMISGDFNRNGSDEILVSALNATTLTHWSFVGGQFVSNPIPATLWMRALALHATSTRLTVTSTSSASDASTTVLLFNTGAGVFAAPVSYPASEPSIIVPVDLDGNGLSDVVIVSPFTDPNLIPQTIEVRMATGGGSLSAPTSYPVGNITGAGPPGDFDGDGNMDLALTDGRGCVRIFRGLGNGQLETLTPIVSIYAAGTVETGDLDGDGDADVVAADLEFVSVSVLLNQAGVLAPPVAYPVAASSLQLGLLELSDLDADGDLDLATAIRTSTSVSVLRNNGNGTFAPFTAYFVPNTTIDIAAEDVDGDGDVDLLVAHVGASPAASELTLLLNNGTGVFTLSPSQSLGNVVTGFAIGDLDGDGDPDAVFSSSGLGGALLRFQNSGSGTFTFQQAVNIGSSSRNVLLVDIDADGDLDALETALPDQVVICLNTNGVLQPPYTARTGQNPRDLRAADFDADGVLDLATAGPAYAVSVIRNQGNGLFDPPILRASYGLATSIDPADLDGDGSMDVVVSNSVSGVISIVRACSNQVGSPYCAGDGSATACPCGNASPVGADAGCLHSLGSGGTLRAHGYARLSADTLVLVGEGMPNASALYFQGTTQVNGGAGAVFGDGLRLPAAPTCGWARSRMRAARRSIRPPARRRCTCEATSRCRAIATTRCGIAMLRCSARARLST